MNALATACLKCGAPLGDVKPERMPGHMHASNRSWMGFVQFTRVVYICPRCGAPNTRDRRVRWGGDEGKH
jgi:ribosomal protein L40E